MTLEVRGPNGVSVISITSGQPLSNLVKAVNDVKNFTGVEASLINNDPNSGMVFRTIEFGSQSVVSVQRLQKPADSADSWSLYKFESNQPVVSDSPFGWTTLLGSGALSRGTTDEGRDVSALINGNLATGTGLRVSVNSPSLALDLVLNQDLATRPAATPTSFYITGAARCSNSGRR